MSSNPSSMFYAYASYPPFVGESIDAFAEEFNKSGNCIIRTWKSMDVVGLSITPEILSNIDSCDAFACDLTTLNLNVFI